ncbi:MAG: type VI secretion protein IcmF/TssM N-terminal domain-containing protein, partial [Pseudomonadota bacterium]|nr:type VI secretion protein IcmF/TssM N-terminal domain-containing protein [Pseudomonadota bacterium]
MGTIQEIISILSRFFNVPRWVWIIIGLLIVAGLLYTVYKRFAPKRKPKPPPTEAAPKEAAEQQSPQHKALRKELKQFFRYLLKQLRLHAPGRNYRYQIPWLLLIGEAESGKSTLLAHNQLNRPLGDPKAPQGGCQVWFFDKGLVLDVSGDYILHQDNIASDQLGWRTFLKLLHHYRPRRPIDEVILTIPCQDLLSQQHNPETLQQKAEHLYQKLWEAQNVSGIRFPVYIVITQSDQMTGFSSFCQALPERFQHHIFGWSNPYTLDTGYKSSLAEEAFTKIYRDLNELQIELVVAFSDIADTDAFLLFPHQFRQIFKNLKIYLDQLFKPSVYHEAFFFRGVYFCGDMAENNLISRRQTVATSDEIDFNILLDEHSQSRHLVFLHHLFRDKLFAEANLARPVFRSLRHRSQMLWAVQGALAAFIIGMILGQWWAYQRIAAEKKSVLKLLTDIEKDLNQLQAERENLNWEYTRQTRQTNAQDFLYGLANIRSDGFSSVFLPPSWLSNVDEQVIQALAKGYNIFISEWMHDGLQRKAEAAIHPNVMPGATDSHDFTQLPTFKALKKFITDLNRLNNNVKRYNAIKESHDINEMNQLVSYLFGVDLPTQFQSQSIFYRATLATVEYEPFELKPLDHIQVARNEAEDLVYQWFERIFRENALYTEVEKLRQILEELDDISREELATSLINLRNSMRRIDQFLTQPEWRWVAKEQLNETLAVEKLFNSIKETSLLGTELSDNLLKLGEARFQEFRQTLLSLQSELTGPILEYHRVQTEDTPKTEPKPQNKADTADNPLTQATQKSSKTYAILKLSPQVIALKETLETFTGQAFMKPTTQRGLKTSVPFNMRLVWRTEELKKAIDLKDIFDNYMEKQLPEVNEQLQPVFRQAGQVSLYENMLDWIRAGQHFEPQTIEMQYAEEVLRTQIQKFGKAAPLLEQILAIFEGVEGTNESSRIIRQLGMEQAYRLLERVDNLLVQEQLYMPIEEAFALWQGQQRLSWLVFAVNDQEEMKYYLELQRRRVHYLAENYAKPLLDFLQGKQQFISEQQTNLLPKWQRILKELEKYSTQKTTNSVTRLEKFILFELDKVKINQCVDSMAGALRPTGDYFLEKKRQLQSSLFQRCQKVADAHAFARYDAIEAEFNQTLAGLFPFATLPEDTLFDEASPAHIQTFFHLYDAYGGQE